MKEEEEKGKVKRNWKEKAIHKNSRSLNKNMGKRIKKKWKAK